MKTNLSNTPIKIAIIGQQKVGKTVIANSLSEFSNVVAPDYHPTVGTRILEFEKNYSEEQIKNIPILKANKLSSVKIELWDVSGDKRYESCWPAIKYGLNGVIIVVDSSSAKFDNHIDIWMNGFCSDLPKENVICFSYKKDEDKEEVKKKVCNQFPSLFISEVKNDMNTLLPSFNILLTKILSGMH